MEPFMHSSAAINPYRDDLLKSLITDWALGIISRHEHGYSLSHRGPHSHVSKFILCGEAVLTCETAPEMEDLKHQGPYTL
jgi:hypothetical protein